jgi:propionyl-CoA carboxylase beta chain
MVENTSYMFLTGPNVIKTVTNEYVTKNELGGALTHNTKSGIAHFSCANDVSAIELARKLISYIKNIRDLDVNLSKSVKEDKNIALIVPTQSNKPYDVSLIINKIVDQDKFIEINKDYAKNLIVGFSLIMKKTIGIVANQANYLAGAIDINASNKAARFVRFCDAFNIPIITLVDTPGFLPGVGQEHSGIIKHGAKLLYAYSESTVPKITIVLRKAYGGAYCVMGSKHLNADFNFAFPTAEIAVVGAEGAFNIIEKNITKNYNENKKKFIENYTKQFQNPEKAAELGYIDEIINPSELKIKIIQGLKILTNKSEILPIKKHGNIPL